MNNNSCNTEQKPPLQVDMKELFEKLRKNVVPTSNESQKIGVNITDESVGDMIARYNLNVVQRSEEAYIKIVENVVAMSGENLQAIRGDKSSLRDVFVGLFRYVLMIQLVVLFLLLGCNSLIPFFNISDNVIITYMTTVFVETLSVIAVMIVFAFKSSEEIEIIGILNSVVKNYQKYNDRKNGKDREKDEETNQE